MGTAEQNRAPGQRGQRAGIPFAAGRAGVARWLLWGGVPRGASRLQRRGARGPGVPLVGGCRVRPATPTPSTPPAVRECLATQTPKPTASGAGLSPWHLCFALWQTLPGAGDQAGVPAARKQSASAVAREVEIGRGSTRILDSPGSPIPGQILLKPFHLAAPHPTPHPLHSPFYSERGN